MVEKPKVVEKPKEETSKSSPRDALKALGGILFKNKSDWTVSDVEYEKKDDYTSFEIKDVKALNSSEYEKVKQLFGEPIVFKGLGFPLIGPQIMVDGKRKLRPMRDIVFVPQKNGTVLGLMPGDASEAQGELKDYLSRNFIRSMFIQPGIANLRGDKDEDD